MSAVNFRHSRGEDLEGRAELDDCGAGSYPCSRPLHLTTSQDPVGNKDHQKVPSHTLTPWYSHSRD